MSNIPYSAASLFEKNVEVTDGCWTWVGHLGKKDYGRVTFRRTRYQAHRLIYEILVGPIPDGKQLDHLCRNSRCVNPEHLEPVTIKENVLRGIGISAENARKTICKRGHPLVGENMYITTKGGRGCKRCMSMHQRLFYRKKVSAGFRLIRRGTKRVWIGS